VTRVLSGAKGSVPNQLDNLIPPSKSYVTENPVTIHYERSFFEDIGCDLNHYYQFATAFKLLSEAALQFCSSEDSSSPAGDLFTKLAVFSTQALKLTEAAIGQLRVYASRAAHKDFGSHCSLVPLDGKLVLVDHQEKVSWIGEDGGKLRMRGELLPCPLSTEIADAGLTEFIGTVQTALKPCKNPADFIGLFSAWSSRFYFTSTECQKSLSLLLPFVVEHGDILSMGDQDEQGKTARRAFGDLRQFLTRNQLPVVRPSE